MQIHTKHHTTNTSRIVALGALVLIALFGLAAAADPPPQPDAATIYIKAFMFTPMELTVRAGTTVTWKNLDEEPHTVRSVDERLKTGALDQNESYSFTFDKPGTFKYVCSIHPSMVGTIVVKAG